MNQLVQNKKDATSKIGQTIGTIYGPCEVIRLDVIDNEECVILDENGEQFNVKLSEWHELIRV